MTWEAVALVGGAGGYLMAQATDIVKAVVDARAAIKAARSEARATIEAAKRRMEENGPCNADYPDLLGGHRVAWCRFPAGHDGDHLSAEGERWRVKS